MAILVPILTTFQTSLQSIFDDWFQKCVIVIDLKFIEQKKIFEVDVIPIGDPYKKISFVFVLEKHDIEEIALIPVRDPDSLIISALEPMICPGSLCPGRGLDGKKISPKKFEVWVNNFSNNYAFNFGVRVAENTGGPPLTASSLKVFVKYPDDDKNFTGPICRVEEWSIFNALVGSGPIVRIIVLVLLIAFIGLVVRRLSSI